MNRRKLTASSGMILTDGEIYGRVIYLGEGIDENAFHEITEEEYESIMLAEIENENNKENTI